MNILTQSCPEIQAIAKAMMSGGLCEERSGHNDGNALSRHLDDCENCQAAIEAMATSQFHSDQIAGILKRSGTVASPVSNTRGAQSGLLRSDEGAEGTYSPDHRHALFLSCLSPTDNPDSLGRIGTLEIRGVIGHGGAGIVYKAIDPALGRTVAVKLLNPATASDEARARFSREARAMAAITHENVLPVHAVSQHHELPYLVTEYVPGGTLAQRLAVRGRLELIETVRVGLQIARGLAAAHRQGVVHRDVKPSNILLDPGIDRVRVADFGLARAVNEHTSTESGKLMGTPQFMSPEQVQGGAVSFSSDLFSLGCVLFQCCTGHPPFAGDSIYSIMQKITNEEAPSARQECADVPEWLDCLIRRLHSRRPNDRFENADAVAEILEAELLFLQQATLVPQPERKWLPIKAARTTGIRKLSGKTVMTATGIVLTIGLIATQFIYDGENNREPHIADSSPTDQSGVAHVESSQDERSRVVTLRPELQSWADQLVAATDHREVAFGIAPKLSKLPNDDSLAIAHAAWPRMLESGTRTGLLKEFQFSSHPKVLQILHLGMTDTDTEVRRYAANYLQEFALRDFDGDEKGYNAWYAVYGKRPLADVYSANYQRLTDDLRSVEPNIALRILKPLNIGISEHRPQKRDAVRNSGLPELIVGWCERTLHDEAQLRELAEYLARVPLSPDLASQRVQKFLSNEHSTSLRMAAATALLETHREPALDTLFDILNQTMSMEKNPLADLNRSWCCHVIATVAEVRSIPRLIAIMDSDNSPEVRRIINSVLCGDTRLGQLTGVSRSTFLDGPWWRKWWEANRARLPEPAATLVIEELPKTKFGRSYQPITFDLSTHDGRMKIFRDVCGKPESNVNSQHLWSISTTIAEAGDPRAIPILIGAIEADNSYDTVYGIGYFALGFSKLGKLTGVEYSKFHDGAWWRRWWESNKDRFPEEVQAIPIENFPKTAHGKNYTPFPSDLDTHEGRVKFLIEQLRKPEPDLSSLAELFTEYEDPRGIPVLIGVIVADQSGKSVYDVGYFGLGMGKLSRITGVRYDKSHDAEWWVAWWATHRRDLPAEANVDIPKFEMTMKGEDEEAPDADVQDIPSHDIRIADDPNQRYFLIGDTSVSPPKSGFKLLVVLPGGDGSADFEPFVRRIRKYALDDQWILAQPVAVFWNTTTPKDQQIVWPKKSDNVADAKFSTEEFVSRTIADVKSKVPIDPKNVITLSWSSSGHAAYAIAMQPDSPVTGSYIAMSIFRAKEYDTAHVKGRRLVIDHSPDDQVCPYDHSVTAEKTLTAAGADIKRLTCEGGHGWRGDAYGRIKEGLQWLTLPR